MTKNLISSGVRKRLVFAILVMGFSGIIGQILLLRELLITFCGNELSIGIILANWLILEAIGSFFLGKSVERIKKKLQGFVALQIVFSIGLPSAIYLTRILKEMMGVSPGEGLGLLPVFISSFFILALVSVPHGALFTFSCKIYSLFSRQPAATSIGKVYIFETLGTIAGGIGFTYLLVSYFHSLLIAFGVALLNLIICVFLLGPFRQKKQIVINKILGILSGALLILCAYLIFSSKADEIHEFSVRRQWKGQEVVHYQNSIYGNIAVTRRENQYTFFSDGIPTITTPVPDITFVEEFVHLPMLFHPRPEEILVISGGAGGVINEILKYGVKRVDYAELDPLLLELVEKFPTPLTESELSNARVNIEYVDGRLLVKRSGRRYDLVFVGLSNPSDLQVNRLFTQEFFSLVKKRLQEEGILVIGLPGSLTYLSEELKNLNACILNTLKSVYPTVRIIPGDGTNLFLASSSKNISLIDQEKLSQRMKARNLKVSLLTPAHIEYKLHPRWRDWFFRSLQGGTQKINRDFRPLGLFYSLSYWNARFSPYLRRTYRWLEKISLPPLLAVIVVFTLVFLLIRSQITRLVRLTIPFCIITTGFAGMIFDLALIFTFQVLCGYVFYWIGILVTAFMAGVAGGSFLMTGALGRIKKDLALFIKIELGIVLFAGILPVVFIGLRPYLDRPSGAYFLQIIFFFLSFSSGFLVGAEFPLASKIHLGISPRVGRTAGLLYGADLLGGWIGGIVGGVVLLPVLGLLGACLVVVMLKVSSLILLATSREVKSKSDILIP